ncbi:MAG: bifunctional oligoribonuclease/PAP phosphatase NrnA [Candidatus Wallbacteria bacterium]|nr:bifunctional oligoribonuclease/PAP phosphatase NrnA [Candidatus Wallbacteria bacterium]
MSPDRSQRVRRARRQQARRLHRLVELMRKGRSLLVMTHDNPDPDSIASALVLQKLARERAGIRADIGYGGIVGRGENRSMLKSLSIELRKKSDIDFSDYDLFALVDTQPHTGNNSLPSHIRPDIVIDHHPLRKPTRSVRFHDVRRHYGATTTALTEYLFASRLKLDPALATALFYGIKSETQSLGREASAADKAVYTKLFLHMDAERLWRIEHSPLSPKYFAMMADAIHGTRVHGDVAIACLGEIAVPDMVAEFADLLMRLEHVAWAFCFGLFHGDLYLSLRTSDRAAEAGEIIQEIVGSEGKAGGHGMIAGGKIQRDRFAVSGCEKLQDLLRARLLGILRKADLKGTPLIELEPRSPAAV